MKKVIISLLIVLVLIVGTFLITYKLIPYTQKDVDRVVKIYLKKVDATPLDYFRLDMNKDNKITLLDGAMIVKKINNEE